MAIFEKYPPASWEVKGFQAITFPVDSLNEDGGNRLASHERPRRDGAKFDDTGSRPKRYTFKCSFHLGSEEPDVQVDILYPDILNQLLRSADVHEVGTLVVPTKGPRRCRFESYQRSEVNDERDCASVTFVFVEDNEDSTTASSFTAPSARSVARIVAAAAVSSLEYMGCDGTDFGTSLSELASSLEKLASGPAEFVADLQAKANQLRTANERILEAFSGGASPQGLLLRDPVSSLVHRKLAALSDLTARAVAERLSNEPRLTPVRFQTQMSIAQVAAKYNQDFAKLLAANTAIGDPFAIPANTPVLIYSAS